MIVLTFLKFKHEYSLALCWWKGGKSYDNLIYFRTNQHKTKAAQLCGYFCKFRFTKNKWIPEAQMFRLMRGIRKGSRGRGKGGLKQICVKFFLI